MAVTKKLALKSVSGWNPIGSHPSSIGVTLFGKKWDSKTDKFEYRMFHDYSYWGNDWHNPINNERIEGGWHLTHWRDLPDPPATRDSAQ